MADTRSVQAEMECMLLCRLLLYSFPLISELLQLREQQYILASEQTPCFPLPAPTFSSAPSPALAAALCWDPLPDPPCVAAGAPLAISDKLLSRMLLVQSSLLLSTRFLQMWKDEEAPQVEGLAVFCLFLLFPVKAFQTLYLWPIRAGRIRQHAVELATSTSLLTSLASITI